MCQLPGHSFETYWALQESKQVLCFFTNTKKKRKKKNNTELFFLSYVDGDVELSVTRSLSTLCCIVLTDLAHWCQRDGLIVTALNRWKSLKRKSWDLRKELMELLCLPLLSPTVALRSLAIIKDRYLTKLIQIQSLQLQLLSLLIILLGVVVTRRSVPHTPVNHFLATLWSCAECSMLSDRKYPILPDHVNFWGF